MKRSVFLRGAAASIALAVAGPAAARDGRDQLFRAIISDDAATVGQLLRAGVDPNSRNDKGVPALYLALQEDALDAARVLLQSDRTDVNQLNDADESPLMMAAYKDHMELAQVLVSRGASLNKSGWTPLHYAATKGHVQMMRYLIGKGANINALSPNDTTPLMMAARYGSAEAVRLLLAFHADPAMTNQQDMNALDFARSANREDIAKLLQGTVDLGW